MSQDGDVNETAERPKARRGFAVMDRARVSEAGKRGADACHALGLAHRFTSEEAREAGRKGGNAPHVRRGRGKAAP